MRFIFSEEDKIFAERYIKYLISEKDDDFMVDVGKISRVILKLMVQMFEKGKRKSRVRTTAALIKQANLGQCCHGWASALVCEVIVKLKFLPSFYPWCVDVEFIDDSYDYFYLEISKKPEGELIPNYAEIFLPDRGYHYMPEELLKEYGYNLISPNFNF